jgi:hypothetical protein
MMHEVEQTDQTREAIMNIQARQGTTVEALSIVETPAEIAKAMSIMGGWMFLWTGALLLLVLV